MQTFLPRASFGRSAKDLDMRRLGKQRVEAYQIIRTLLGESQGWKNHPAVKMWSGYEAGLYAYGQIICAEWKFRGYKDTVADKLYVLYQKHMDLIRSSGLDPDWHTPELMHSHQANLVAKFPEHYIPLYGNLKPVPYVWPVK